ncbi:MAG TPA: outer membrane protein [Xanthobacteraceae bacterium]|nr:outer membrane protein [Xanthobacteraceae bacterium]
MRRLLLTTALVTVAAPAFAADLARAPVAYKAPAVIQSVYNWSGFYIGANLGGGWANARGTSTFVGGVLGGAVSPGRGDLNGVIGGAQIGINWQAGSIVYGLEADLQAAGQSSSASVAFGPVTLTERAKVDWFGTVRGRLGVAADNLLIYVTGGVAWTHANHRVDATFAGATTRLVNVDSTRAGYTLGAGLEYGFTPNWSAKAEYLYIDTQKVGTTAAFAAPLGGTVTDNFRIHNHIVRAGVNYRF